MSKFSFKTQGTLMGTVLKKVLLFLAVVLSLTGCQKEAEKQPEKAIAKSSDNLLLTPDAVCCFIGTSNQANHKVEVYDPAVNPWTSPVWSWKPTAALGYDQTAEISLWDNPVDQRVRNNSLFGGSQVIIACSGRLATIATYPGGVKRWTMGFSSGTGLHGVELLPTGNCVVAAADGGWIRIYSSAPANANKGVYHQYPVSAAHAAAWDPTAGRLWVVGYNYLQSYTVTGTLANPELTLQNTYTLPTLGGHYVSTYTGNTNLLWVSSNTGAWTFNKTTGLFTQAPGDAYHKFVKAISNQITGGQIIETTPNSGSACTVNDWCTKTVDFYTSAGVLSATRTISSAAFYRGMSWNPAY
jgi:hypothetical protein